MQQEQVKTNTINPRILTDKELVNFAERFLLLGTSMPEDFQQELVDRLYKRIN
jgi:hypothetical protein